MASDLDILLTVTLDERASGDVDPAALMRSAVTRGRRIRRRRAISAGVVLAVVTVLGAATALLPPPHRDPRPVPAAPGVLFAGRQPLLPPAAGRAGAAADPRLVGSDPRVLHFSVDALAGTATRVSWENREIFEKATVVGDDFRVIVSISRNEGGLLPSLFRGGAGPVAPVRVGARSGTIRSATAADDQGLTLSVIHWNPVDDLYAMVEVWAKAPADAVRAASLVRFDRAQRCVLPFDLTSPPAGMTVASCTVSLTLQPRTTFYQGTLSVDVGGKPINIHGSMASSPEPFTDGLTAGPHRVHASDGSYTLVAPPYWVVTTVQGRVDPADERAKMLQVLSHLRTRGQPTDPGSW